MSFVVVITRAGKSFNRKEKKNSFEAWNKIWLKFPHWVTELLLCDTGNKVKYEFRRQLLATLRNPVEGFHVSELIKLSRTRFSRKYFLHRYLRIMPRVSSWKSQTIAHKRWGEGKMMKNLFALKLICNFFLIFSTCTNFPWKPTQNHKIRCRGSERQFN